MTAAQARHGQPRFRAVAKTSQRSHVFDGQRAMTKLFPIPAPSQKHAKDIEHKDAPQYHKGGTSHHHHQWLATFRQD